MAATGTIFDRYQLLFPNFEKVWLRIGDSLVEKKRSHIMNIDP